MNPFLIFWKSWKSLLTSIPFLLKRSLLPFLIFVVLAWLQGYVRYRLSGWSFERSNDWDLLVYALLNELVAFLRIAVFASVCIAFHRKILMGEQTGGFLPKFGRFERRYAATSLGVILLFWLPVVPAAIYYFIDPFHFMPGFTWELGYLLIGYLASMAIVAYLSPLFPGVILKQDGDWFNAIRAQQRSTLARLAAFLMILGPVHLIYGLIEFAGLAPVSFNATYADDPEVVGKSVFDYITANPLPQAGLTLLGILLFVSATSYMARSQAQSDARRLSEAF